MPSPIWWGGGSNICLDVDLCNAGKQIVENEDALKKQKLMQIIQMLGFVLSSTADQAQLNLQPQARDCSGMRFLCNLFSCCKWMCICTNYLGEGEEGT